MNVSGHDCVINCLCGALIDGKQCMSSHEGSC